MEVFEYPLNNRFTHYFSYPKPQVNFKNLDEWYAYDKMGYLEFLTNFRQKIKELLKMLLFSSENKSIFIDNFLMQHSSYLQILELTNTFFLLKSIMDTENAARLEELKSELYYQFFHIIESINQRIHQKKSDIYQQLL